jgi:putative heme-binding domain-containing protein
VAADTQLRETAGGREVLANLAAQIGKQQRPEDVIQTVQTLKRLAEANSTLLPIIVLRLAARPRTPLAEQIAAATGGKADALMKKLIGDAARRAADESAPLPSRVAAIEQLRLSSFGEQQELLGSLLAPAIPAEVQAAALATLGSYDTAGVAELIISRFSILSPRLKGQATDVLLSRPAWTLSLLAAIETGRISTGDLDPVRLKLLSEHRNEAIRARAAKLLTASQLSRRADVVEAYRGVLEMTGDASRGQDVFAKTCAACHRVQGVGFEIGPSLAAMKARGSEAILLNVLDPNREVNPQYLNYAVLTTDGRQLTGMIAAETATGVTLRRADNATDTILRIDIEQLKSTGMSLMPEGMEKQIDQQAMADLLEFLRVAE